MPVVYMHESPFVWPRSASTCENCNPRLRSVGVSKAPLSLFAVTRSNAFALVSSISLFNGSDCVLPIQSVHHLRNTTLFKLCTASVPDFSQLCQWLCALLFFVIARGLLSFPLGVKQHGFRNNVKSKGNTKHNFLLQFPPDTSTVTNHTPHTLETHSAALLSTHNKLTHSTQPPAH